MVCLFYLSSQRITFNSVDFCYILLCFFFIYFFSDFCDFFPSANFGFLLFLVTLGMKLGYLLMLLLFLEVGLYCYESSS